MYFTAKIQASNSADLLPVVLTDSGFALGAVGDEPAQLAAVHVAQLSVLVPVAMLRTEIRCVQAA